MESGDVSIGAVNLASTCDTPEPQLLAMPTELSSETLEGDVLTKPAAVEHSFATEPREAQITDLELAAGRVEPEVLVVAETPTKTSSETTVRDTSPEPAMEEPSAPEPHEANTANPERAVHTVEAQILAEEVVQTELPSETERFDVLEPAPAEAESFGIPLSSEVLAAPHEGREALSGDAPRCVGYPVDTVPAALTGDRDNCPSGGVPDGKVSGEPCDQKKSVSTARNLSLLLTPSLMMQHLLPVELWACSSLNTDCRKRVRNTATPEQLWHKELGARRGPTWKALLLSGVNLEGRSSQDVYVNLCSTPSPHDTSIRRDVFRTFPQEDLFREKGGKGQLALFRVLHALAIRLWDVGYCQSLNFLAATMIGVFPDDEEAAFHCALAILLRHSLLDLYRPRFTKLGVVLWQFDRIVECFLPKVHAGLQQHGVNAEYYAMQWFLTLFSSDLSQAAVRRVWDRFLIKGWQVVVQVGLALLHSVEDTLPQLDNSHALRFLKTFARSNLFDPEQLLVKAASFDVSHQMLSALEAAYNWEGQIQLFVVKDLNNGEVHWTVASFPPEPKVPPFLADSSDEELPPPVPQAFKRQADHGEADPYTGRSAKNGAPGEGTVLPFLIHNLDTGETEILESAWNEYKNKSHGTPQARGQENANASRSRGSFWMENMQRQAARRLGRA